MEGQQGSVQVLVHRVASLPVPAAVISQATQAYQKTKESNRLVNSALNIAEGTVLWGYAKAVPIAKVFDKPIESIGSFAVKKLDNIETGYPVVKKTPEELLNEYKRLSETNSLVKTVDYARLAALYGFDKVQNTTKMATDMVGGVQTTASNVIKKGLDVSENIIDHYIIPADLQQSMENGDIASHSGAEVPVIHRLSNMSGKLVTGVKARAWHGYGATKVHAEASLKQLEGTIHLLEHAKQLSEWAKKNETLTSAQKQTIQLWESIKAQAEKTKRDPESVAVDVVKSLASGSDKAFERLIASARPYISENLLSPVASTAAFIHHLNETFSKATHLSQIKDELVVHAREKLADVEDLMMRLVDMASNLPAAKWMVNISENHISNGFLSHQQSKENGHKG